MPLLLAGGGDEEQSKPVDKWFAQQLPPDPSMLYIPIAMPKEEHTYDECGEWIHTVFNPLNINDITMVTDLTTLNSEQLENTDAAYIGGGNTYTLLHRLRTTNTAEKLVNYCTEHWVYGGSAGAIIFGHTIKTASHGAFTDENHVNLEDLTGLQQVHGYDVDCHVNHTDTETLQAYAENTGRPLLAIPETTGIAIEQDTAHVIGDTATVHTPGNPPQHYEPGEHFSLQ